MQASRGYSKVGQSSYPKSRLIQKSGYGSFMGHLLDFFVIISLLITIVTQA